MMFHIIWSHHMIYNVVIDHYNSGHVDKYWVYSHRKNCKLIYYHVYFIWSENIAHNMITSTFILQSHNIILSNKMMFNITTRYDAIT